MRVSHFVKIIFCLSLVACSSGGGLKGTPSAGFQMRDFKEETLPNGMKLILISDDSLPRISFQMMIKSGTYNDPKGAFGLASLTAQTLDQGTKKRKALELANQFAQIGAEFDAGAQQDYTLISGNGLSTSSAELLNLFAEVVMSPAFDAKELERQRSQSLAALDRTQDNPQAYADLLFDRETFGSHPYGVPVIGNKEGLKKIKREDVLNYYEHHYRPSNAIFAVVGNLNEDLLAQVRKVFGGWSEKTGQAIVSTGAAAPLESQKKLFTKRDLKQTQIRIGHLGIKRNDPDFLPLRIGSLILGGTFSSRLNQRVRDDLGLTYSISSNSDAKGDPGSFEISTFTRNDKAAETVKETMTVFQQFVSKGVSGKELESAQTLLIGQFPAAIETPDRLAMNLMILRRYGISDDYLRNFIPNVRKVTVADVNSAVRKHLAPDKARIIVYGEESQVLSSLKTLGEWAVEEIK